MDKLRINPVSRIRATRLFRFEAAHALSFHDGACKNIHGHSYKMEVTVIGSPNEDSKSSKEGMVIDFSELNALVNDLIISKVDHAVILGPDNIKNQHEYGKVFTLPNRPTCENMVTFFADLLRQEIYKRYQGVISLLAIRLWETDNSYAEWNAYENC